MNRIQKILSAVMFSATIALPVNVFSENAITVFVDNQQMDFEVEPVIKDGTTLVPLRAIFEKFGYEVTWYPETQTILGLKGGAGIQMTIGDKQAFVKGNAISLEVPPVIINGNTLVPLRFIGEANGAKVEWQGDIQKVVITSNPETSRKPIETSTVTNNDKFVNFKWGMTREEVQTVQKKEPITQGKDSAGNYQVVYPYIFETGEVAGEGFSFDVSGKLIKVMYITNQNEDFESAFGVYTLADMDLSYLYNNGNGPDDFQWKIDSTEIQAYKQVYKNDLKGMTEMALRSGDLTLTAKFQSSDSNISLVLMNSGTFNKPKYLVGLTYDKK